MKRHRIKLPLTDENTLKNRLIRTCGESQYGLFLDSHDHQDKYSRYRWLAGFEATDYVVSSNDSLKKLAQFHDQEQDWLLGHLSFNLKNELEELDSRHPDQLDFPHLSFFIPQYLVYHDGEEVWLESLKETSAEGFLDKLAPAFVDEEIPDIHIELPCKTTEHQYRDTVDKLMVELQQGNIYEINYCIEFGAEVEMTNPTAAFLELDRHTEAPFTAFYRTGDQYLLCASPERYLQKIGETVISQPMKGTARRDKDPLKDQELKEYLAVDEKERSENVMITDLVRNDLSRVAKKGSVKVDELFGVYTYKSVHQMLSTVTCEVADSVGVSELLHSSFPMGSMTGAPKVSALNLIERHEKFHRGLYAGSVGYIMPNGDFDLNVVIRSLLYNSRAPYLSARVGSAITIHSNAKQEYEECLLKAESLLKALCNDRLSAS